MKDKKIHIEIVTPYELFYEGDVDQIILPATDGEIGILPGHVPIIVALNPGEIRMKVQEKEIFLAASEGYAEVEVDYAIVVVGSAEWAQQIDVSRATIALQRATQRLNAPETSMQEIARSKRGVLRANARLKVAKRINNDLK